VPDNPDGLLYRNLKVRLLNRAGYLQQRAPTGSNLTYTESETDAYSEERSPLAFEWGETVYLQVYNFPYRVNETLGDKDTPLLPAPTVNINISVEGRSIALTSPARQFKNAADSPNGTGPGGVLVDLDGYAVFQFTFQNAGPNSLPPGNGFVDVTISPFLGGRQVRVEQNPVNARREFKVANPLAVAMLLPGMTAPEVARTIGESTSPSNPENLVNGSPNVAGTAGTKGGLPLHRASSPTAKRTRRGSSSTTGADDPPARRRVRTRRSPRGPPRPGVAGRAPSRGEAAQPAQHEPVS
jgi:hypothetical protein